MMLTAVLHTSCSISLPYTTPACAAELTVVLGAGDMILVLLMYGYGCTENQPGAQIHMYHVKVSFQQLLHRALTSQSSAP
jgi:hypothetical protein